MHMLHQILNKLHGDRIIWFIVGALSLFSVLAVYSSTGTLAFSVRDGNTEYYLLRHGGLILFGLGLMYLAHLPNYRLYSRMAQLLLVISIPLLIITLFFGTDINDARRWITLPGVGISFQTSDLAKLALIMFVARFLSKNQDFVKDFRKGFLPILGIIVVVCALIAPADLSTALVLFSTCMLLLFVGRIHLKFLLGTAVAGALTVAFLILLAFAFPDTGRLGTWANRIENFSTDEAPSYQVMQSKIAIAEGGIVGKGPGNSDQRNYLPHPYSDFIFAIIIEEYGLAGGGVMVFLYLAFLYRSVRIVMKSPGAFGALLAAGLAFSLVIQAFIHMAVVVNLLPVTGLTLPLVSMGGTSVVFTSIAIGIILSVSHHIEANNQAGEVAPAEESDTSATADDLKTQAA